MSAFVVYSTRTALAQAAELGFGRCLEVGVEQAIRDGGFVRRIPPRDHEYALADCDLVVRTRYEHERTPGGRRRFLVVGVRRDQRANRRNRR